MKYYILDEKDKPQLLVEVLDPIHRQTLWDSKEVEYRTIELDGKQVNALVSRFTRYNL